MDIVNTDNPSHARAPDEDAPAAAVTALYEAHALGLVRLAVVMLGESQQAAAEDVVQDAFFGLFRHWSGLADESRALPYVRSAVLNGCRTVLRRRGRPERQSAFADPPPESAEARALIGEEHREVLAAVRRLPDRQREAVVLRYFLDLTEEETAEAMHISRGTVKSATSRAIAAIARMLEGKS